MYYHIDNPIRLPTYKQTYKEFNKRGEQIGVFFCPFFKMLFPPCSLILPDTYAEYKHTQSLLSIGMRLPCPAETLCWAAPVPETH